MKKKRLCAALAAVIISVLGAHSAFAHADDNADPKGTSCDTWARHNPDGTYGTHDRKAAGDQNLNDAAPTPEQLYLENGGDAHTAPRYGVRGRDFYLQALGGGGYGSGQRDDPAHRAAEGGTVQGEVDPYNGAFPGAQMVPDANFSVNAFSMDDEIDNAHWKDTAGGACVSIAGNKVDSGEIYAPTSTLPHP